MAAGNTAKRKALRDGIAGILDGSMTSGDVLASIASVALDEAAAQDAAAEAPDVSPEPTPEPVKTAPVKTRKPTAKELATSGRSKVGTADAAIVARSIRERKAAAKAAAEPVPAPEPEPAPAEAGPERTSAKVQEVIDLRQRDFLLDTGNAEFARIIEAAGREVRVSNGRPRPDSIPAILPVYYRNWRLVLNVTTGQRDRIRVALLDMPRRGKSPASRDDVAAYAEAQAVIAKVNALSGDAYQKAIGTDEAQAALRVLADAAAKSRRVERAAHA